MGVKVKGGMYCKRCDRPVLAQKTSHGVRNGIAVGGVLATGGLSLLGAKAEKWRCPVCGGPAVPEPTIRMNAAIKRAVSGGTRHKTQAKSKPKAGWRCAKHGHSLDKKRATCPIDGSPGEWREP